MPRATDGAFLYVAATAAMGGDRFGGGDGGLAVAAGGSAANLAVGRGKKTLSIELP
ncbi:MAG: hypothetical protein KDN22_17910 [Verrucomicrobiae bacterium]|nr:hypothetical protein [Verrucomicrobiae bacterium]